MNADGQAGPADLTARLNAQLDEDLAAYTESRLTYWGACRRLDDENELQTFTLALATACTALEWVQLKYGAAVARLERHNKWGANSPKLVWALKLKALAQRRCRRAQDLLAAERRDKQNYYGR